MQTMSNRIVVLCDDEMMAAIDRHLARRRQAASSWLRGLAADKLAEIEQATQPAREREQRAEA
ncbi:MAG: hypothetical protein ABSF87_05910 [Xanthobacteraceae bacterium]|jgi:hypothetical protein